MRLREAKQLQVGDRVTAPDVGIKDPHAIAAIFPDTDPRVRLLFSLVGSSYMINYQHLRRVQT